MVAHARASARKRPSVRTRTAYHEAGHAVLSASINDKPHLVSIREDGERLGFSRQKMFARPTSIAQVFLAGFAAEHVLTGRRPRELDREIGFALLARDYPAFGRAFPGSEGRDGHGAIQAVLRIATFDDEDAIRREVDRLYDAARESLTSVWRVVDVVAKVLLESEEIDREGLDAAIGDADIYGPVQAVQRTHGLLPAPASSTGCGTPSPASRAR